MKESVKILFIIDTLEIGGAEKSLLEIVRRFKTFTPIVCTIYPGSNLQASYEEAGIKVITLNLKGQSDYKIAVAAIEEIIYKEKIHIIHTTLYRSDIVGRKLKKKTGLPLINSFVSNSYSIARFKRMSPLRAVKHLFVLFQNRFTASSVDLFISNSHTIKKSNSKALGINERKVKVIYRGRDYKKINTINEGIVQNLINTYKNDDKFVFLNISRLITTKGHADLIHAFGMVNKKNHSTRLLIAGDGPEKETLQKLIKELNLSDYVFLLGNRNDISELLYISDCFVFPSYLEGLPGAVIEAMIAGKITIASAIPENLECVNTNSALLFNPGDISSLYVHMEAVLNNPSHYKHLSEQAREDAVNNFDINTVVHQYETTYNELLNSTNQIDNVN